MSILFNLLKLKLNKEYNFQISFKDIIIDIFLTTMSSLKKFIKVLFKVEDHLGIAPPSRKMPGGIPKEEVEDFLKLLDSSTNFKIREISKDCIEIEK